MSAASVDVAAIITTAIEARFDMPDGWVLSQRRDRRVSWPRQIGMYLLRSRAGWSYETAARAFGRVDHTTALHAEMAIMPRCRCVPDFRDALTEIDEAIDWTTIMKDRNKGQTNRYTCWKCHRHIVTVDVDAGPTPLLFRCMTDGCDGEMESAVYRVYNTELPLYGWYRQDGDETGHLKLRPIDYAKQAEITRELVEHFKAAILAVQERPTILQLSETNPVIRQAEIDGMESQLATLEAELAEFEAVIARSGHPVA